MHLARFKLDLQKDEVRRIEYEPIQYLGYQQENMCDLRQDISTDKSVTNNIASLTGNRGKHRLTHTNLSCLATNSELPGKSHHETDS